MKPTTDAQLVAAAQAGKKAAFVDLVARYQGMVTGITLSILKDFQASEDAAQETFILAWTKISEIQDREKLRPWLAQIARNSALMALREKRPLPTPEKFPGASEVPRPDELIVKKEEVEIVLNALADLPEKLRLPLILFYRDDQSVRNVSEALSLTPDIVKKRLAEGRVLLRRRVVRLLDPVIRATGPGVVFTTAVAGTIGAMMPPAAMAATAISATQKTATLTVVTTSKLSLAATVITLGLCLPGGYYLHKTLNSHASAEVSRPTTSQIIPTSQRTRPSSETSPLVAQWLALKARHLFNGSAGFPDLFQEITALQDPLQREAFTLLAIADWIKLAPDSALAFFSEVDPSNQKTIYYQHRVISEWIRFDAPAALDAVEKQKLWDRGCSRKILEHLAKGDPNHLTRAINLLPPSFSPEFGSRATTAAIAEAARRDFTATLAAIELNLSTYKRGLAISALASFIAETDPSKARTWISQLAPDDQTSTVTKGFILGLAKNDPASAFQELSNFKSTLSWDQESEILKELTETHPAEALAWAIQNPAPDFKEDDDPFTPFTEGRHTPIFAEIANQLAVRGPAVLEELKRNKLIDEITESHLFASNFASNNPEVFSETWKWLKNQESSKGINTLRNGLLTSAVQDNPQRAFQLLEEFKSQSSSYQDLASNLSKTLLLMIQSDYRENLLSDLAKAPKIVLEKLASFPELDLAQSENLPFWQDQLQQLSSQSKPSLAAKLAAAMTRHDPSEAAQWIATLPDHESQQAALKSTYNEWAQNYPEDASQALDSLQGQQNFDQAASGFLGGIAKFDPEAAYAQLQELGPTWRNYEISAEEILLPLAKEEPDLAKKWLSELQLTAEQKQALIHQIDSPKSPSVE